MNTESKLREALRRVKYEAVSLADAQVIALEALAQPSPPEQVERAACGCTEFEQSHCRAGIVAEAHHPDCVKVERAGLVDELIRCAGRRDVLHYGYMGKVMDEKTYAEFTELRDVRVPQLRAALAAQPATAQAVVVSVSPGADGVKVKWLGGFPSIGQKLYLEQAGAVVSDEQISDLWLMSVDCVGLPRDNAISFARAVLALSQGGVK